jgi:hypothetical protein
VKFRNKLIIGALVFVSFVGVADAAEIIVFEERIDSWNQKVSAEFAVNRKLGRAWIDVKVTTERVTEGPPPEEVIMKMVEGLYYDKARKQVLYRTASEPIVCAEDANFLWTTYLKSTGWCLLKPRTEQRNVDDGFNLREQTVAEVFLEVPHAAASEGLGGGGGQGTSADSGVRE